MSKRLGILGGCGAAAGVRMAQQLVQYFEERGAKADADYPDFILYNLPIYGTSELGIEDLDQVRDQLLGAAHTMASWGCTHLIMACNTAHCFAPRVKQMFGGELINVVELAAQEVSSYKKVGVLCSASSMKLHLYDDALQRKGVETLYPTDEEQGWVNRAIAAAMCGEKFGNVSSVIKNLYARGAETVIVGCTELPLCLPPSCCGQSWIDAGKLAICYAGHMLRT